jgi:hypothetical protein
MNEHIFSVNIVLSGSAAVPPPTPPTQGKGYLIGPPPLPDMRYFSIYNLIISLCHGGGGPIRPLFWIVGFLPGK